MAHSHPYCILSSRLLECSGVWSVINTGSQVLTYVLTLEFCLIVQHVYIFGKDKKEGDASMKQLVSHTPALLIILLK